MNNVFLTSCISIDYDFVLLRHFIEYYISLGIDPKNFLIVLNTFHDVNKSIQKAVSLLDQYGIIPADIWCSEYESEEKWSRVNAVLNKRVKSTDWIIHPDADEFLEFPEKLDSLLKKFDERGINAVQGFLVDRISDDLTVKNVIESTDVSIWKQYPVITNLSPLIGLHGVKLMAYKGSIRPNNGSGEVHDKFKNIVHYPYGNIGLQNFDFTRKTMNLDVPYAPGRFNQEKLDLLKSKHNFIVHHFKWNSSVIEKLEQRCETYRRLNRPQLNQSIKFLEFYKNHGKIQI